MNDTIAKKPLLEMQGTRLFANWLASTGSSIALTTYQAGKIFLIGLQQDGNLSVFERTFERTMGLGVTPTGFWVSSLYQMWRFENFLEPKTMHEGYDALFVPVAGHTTGDIDIHDVHLNAEGQPIFIATRFNCIATLSERGSFTPIWKPPFIDRIAAEDRCHLNGLAVQDGQPAYVTAVATSNVMDGWREKRRDGGVVIDVESNEIVLKGLSMPHSPRLHQGKLWLLQAGTGEFGWVDLEEGKFEPICFLPGFARGVSFHGNYAVIGLSGPRENRTFEGLELNERLAKEGASAQCAVCVVNLKTGDVEHRLSIEGLVSEIYDVQLLPGTIRPMMLGFKSDEIRFRIKPDGEL